MPDSLAVTATAFNAKNPSKTPHLCSPKRTFRRVSASEARQNVDLGGERTGMPHRYKVREIAQQAGLSEATVDRVLNDRPGVRENTRAEVAQAIADLDKQRAQLRLNGRRYLIDVMMQTPRRFSDAFRDAVEAELPAFAPAMLRARFHLWESGSGSQMADALSRIRGSHGVILKAQDAPEVAE